MKIDDSTVEKADSVAYSTKEIISVLSNVDNKIISLQECSSEDFMTFNAYLKKYNQVAKEVSENAKKVFNILSGQTNNESFRELKKFYNALEKQTTNFEEQIDQTQTMLKKILSNKEKMFVPLKNFNQNIMTLKFLNANLKFNIAYFQNKLDVSIEITINQLNQLITNIRSIYPVIESSIFQLKGTVKKSLNRLKEIKNRNINDAKKILNKTNSSIELIFEKQKKAIDYLPILTDKTQSYFAKIDNIITNLQYHDIIRQKMEHIQKTHQEIISKLKEMDTPQNKENNKSIQRTRGICGLQVAQLIHTNKQYQTAIGDITKSYLEIGEDLDIIANVCRDFSMHTQKTDDTHFDEIEEKLQNAVTIIRKMANARQEFAFERQLIHNSVEKLITNFKILANFNADFNIFVSDIINASIIFENNSYEFDSLASQIKNLSSDISENNERLQDLLLDTLKLDESFNRSMAKYSVNDNFTDSYNELSNDIHNIISNLNNDNYIVRTALRQNKELSTDISTQIKASIEQVKYYDFFEDIIEQIIIQLNKLYLTLKSENEYADTDDTKQNIQNLEARYTMESQRKIHSQYANSEIDSLELFQDVSGEQTNDDDIELF